MSSEKKFSQKAKIDGGTVRSLTEPRTPDPDPRTLYEEIISMYSYGMSERDIKAKLKKTYNLEVPSDLISRVTDELTEEVREWRNRPLEKSYSIVYLDALRVRNNMDGKSSLKNVYIALAVNIEGMKEVLGIWVAENDGVDFWTGVLAELKGRCVQDIFIACVEGLEGFHEAASSIYPDTRVQLCIHHMVRHSTRFVSYKDVVKVRADLRAIYAAEGVEEGLMALENFGKTWNDKYPIIYPLWQRHWDLLKGIYGCPPEIRRTVYTTNAIESMNRRLRKVIKKHSAFSTDEAIYKILYLAIRNVTEKWTMPVKGWKQTLNEFALEFGRDRVFL